MLKFQENIVFLSLKFDFVLANPDEICCALCSISSGSSLFSKVPFEGFPVFNGLIENRWYKNNNKSIYW